MDIFKDAVEDSAVATLISHEILRLPIPQGIQICQGVDRLSTAQVEKLMAVMPAGLYVIIIH